MNKSCKMHTFTVLLLTTNMHVIKSSPSNNRPALQIFIEFFYGKPSIEEEIEKYLQQLDVDLNGSVHNRYIFVPLQEVKEIQAKGRLILAELTSDQLKNTDYVNQLINSVMKEHVEQKAILTAQKCTFDHNRVHSTARAIGNNFTTRLEHTPNRNGHALLQFFGQSRDDMVRSAINNPTYNIPTTWNNNR